VNRSQRDIDENKPMSEAMADEQRFFESHPVYKSIAYKSGTKYLAKTLNSVCRLWSIATSFHPT
jgi:dynamin 1-like protein